MTMMTLGMFGARVNIEYNYIQSQNNAKM